MENASKALIIAGEILIGVLIISLASYIIIQFGTFSRNLNIKMEEAQIVQFNVKFTNYEGRANISSQEIATIINFAKQRNEEYNVSQNDEFYIDVCIDGNSVLNTNINEYLEENKNNTYYYCNLKNVKIIKDGDNLKLTAITTDEDILYNFNTQFVNKINFHEIKGANAQEFSNALLEAKNIIWDIK